MRFGVAVQTDMPHFCVWNQLQYAGNHTESRAKNRNHAHRATGNHFAMRGSHRRFHIHVLQRQILRRLVRFEHRDFFGKLHKLLRARRFIAQNRQLMLDQRMPNVVKFGVIQKFILFHDCISPCCSFSVFIIRMFRALEQASEHIPKPVRKNHFIYSFLQYFSSIALILAILLSCRSPPIYSQVRNSVTISSISPAPITRSPKASIFASL